MEKIVSLCKRRGFIFQSSEIYGGINGFWDYGPLGAELKRNVKELWWNEMTRQRDDVAGLEATIIMHPQIWKASGHVDTFSDPMCDCLLTKKRFRADQIEAQSGVAFMYTGAIDKTAFDECREIIAANRARFTLEPEGVIEALARGDQSVISSKELKQSVELIKEGRHQEVDFDLVEIQVLKKIESAKKVIEGFSVLLQPGKPPQSARTTAIQFFSQ